MRLKDHYACYKAEPLCSLFQAGEHSLMAQMHSIEISYGNCYRSFCLSRDASTNKHGAPLKY
jgi:hypothetical protein